MEIKYFIILNFIVYTIGKKEKNLKLRIILIDHNISCDIIL